MEDDAKGFVVGISSVVLVIIGLIVAGMYALPAYSRYQDRANEQNQIFLNSLKIQQTQQLVEVEKQKAAIKLAEAVGIRKAQDEINATLTNKYLQHEAIEAQRHMADSPNHTTIYIPTGNNGIPLVKTVDEDK